MRPGRSHGFALTALLPAAKPLASADALVLEGVSPRVRRAAGDRRRLALGRRRRAARRPRRQRRRQDHAVQRHHRRLSRRRRARVRFFGEDITGLPPYERIRRGLAPHLPVVAAVPRPHGARQPFPGGARRQPRPLQLHPPARAAHPSRVGDPGPARRIRLAASATSGWSRSCRTASSASSRSAWRWPARRA